MQQELLLKQVHEVAKQILEEFTTLQQDYRIRLMKFYDALDGIIKQYQLEYDCVWDVYSQRAKNYKMISHQDILSQIHIVAHSLVHSETLLACDMHKYALYCIIIQ